MIIARRMTVIQKNGFRTEYTHVTSISTVDDCLVVYGEIEDIANGCCNVVDKYEIKDLEHTYIDWYVPKV